jgi:N-acetylneuraminic acid mutarotase
MQKGFRALGVVALIASLHACGGGGMGSSSTPAPPEVVSVAVTPVNPSVPAGMTAQFVATATYSDNSTRDVTSIAEWSSSSVASATVNSATGKASALAEGQATIKANLGAVSGDTMMTVISFPNSSATLLSNGKVLVAGGDPNQPLNTTPPENAQNAVAAAWVYDPSANTWTSVASMSMPRVDHTATALPDGTVLVSGGINFTQGQPVGTAYASAEIYDPVANSWSPAGNMAVGRAGHTATLLVDGRVLVAGGSSDGTVLTATMSAEIYDPATRAWSSTSNMNSARFSHTAVALPDGRALIVGGQGPGGPPQTVFSAENFDPTANAWTLTAPLPSDIYPYQNTTVLLLNGQVLVAGGANFYPGVPRSVGTTALYDPLSDAWSAAANIGERSQHSATLLANGKVLITGGYDVTIFSGLSTAALYDPSTNSVTQEPNLPNVDYGQTALLLGNGAVLITGGIGNSWLYSP